LNGIWSNLEYKSEVIVHTISVYICVDREWITSPHINVEYDRGVEEFIQFAQWN